MNIFNRCSSVFSGRLVLYSLWLATSLVGCGGGSSDSTVQASTAPTSESRSTVLSVNAAAASVAAAPLKGLAGKCLDITNNNQTPGTRVQLYGCNGTDAQQWVFDGTQVKSTAGLCLDVFGALTANGTNIAVWTCHGGQNQQWSLQGTQLKSAASGKCLDVYGFDTADGARITLWDCIGGQVNQHWTSAAAMTGGVPPGDPVTPPTAAERDPWLWPFAQNSIWNMPIGSNAKRVNANLPGIVKYFSIDEEYFIRLKATDPVRPVYAGNDWVNRCTNPPTSNPQHPGGLTVPFPDDFVLNRSRLNYTPNEVATLLLPDGKTLLQLEPLTRCEKAGPVYGWTVEGETLFGAGIKGAHFGSGLSGIGGSIRKGDMTGSEPIRHALKINLWAKYLYFDQQTNRGFRWPAPNSDNYASKTTYTGTLPHLQMGSLLALPLDATPEKLGITTDAGKKIFYALKNYGAYVVDDSAWDAVGLSAEIGVSDEVLKTYGYGLDGGKDNPISADMDRMVKFLQVITNNTESTIGGGGTPLAPLAPPFKGQSNATTKYRVMPLGDSITANTGYRKQLRDDLATTGYNMEFVGTQSDDAGNHEGHGGFTIGPDASRYCYSAEPSLACTGPINIYGHLEEYLATNPDVILLLIGVNDNFSQSRKSGELGLERPVNPADAAGKLEQLVKRIQQLKPQAHIFVASLLPTSFAANINPAQNDKARALGEASSTDKVHFVDMNKEVGFVGGDWADAVHPTDSGYRKMTSVWLKAIESTLQK